MLYSNWLHAASLTSGQPLTVMSHSADRITAEHSHPGGPITACLNRSIGWSRISVRERRKVIEYAGAGLNFAAFHWSKYWGGFCWVCRSVWVTWQRRNTHSRTHLSFPRCCRADGIRMMGGRDESVGWEFCWVWDSVCVCVCIIAVVKDMINMQCRQSDRGACVIRAVLCNGASIIFPYVFLYKLYQA